MFDCLKYTHFCICLVAKNNNYKIQKHKNRGTTTTRAKIHSMSKIFTYTMVFNINKVLLIS